MTLLIMGIRLSASASSTLVQAVVLKMVEPPVLERLTEVIAKKKEEAPRFSKAVEQLGHDKIRSASAVFTPWKG
jgi:hypothetical protein